jgi:hypothetical protein
VSFRHIGDPNSPPPHTWRQISANHSIWLGPLGPYYSAGLVEEDKVFYATQESDWDWNANGTFTGLAGIAYSSNRGQSWVSAHKTFPAPLGNLSWVIRGRGGAHPDGYVYALGTEREFNANAILMGRAKPGIENMTDPADWQWVSGWTTEDGVTSPVWSNSLNEAIPVLPWRGHVTYPQMSFDAPLRRYLLTFTYSYANRPPAIWRNGAELLVMEAPHPWGPYSFIAHEPEFGPSNGYAPGFPVQWISRNGQDLWLKWSANFDGCARWLNCSGVYGFNFRRVHLTVAGGH